MPPSTSPRGVAEPSLSVVIAAWPDTTGLGDCLASVAPQRGPGTELIVVSPEPSRATPVDVTWLLAPPGLLIPHLWSLGMARARGEVVALTTSHFTPAPDWLAVIAAAHARLDSAAVGGPVDPPRGRGLVEWATYFLRYSAYLRYRSEQGVEDLAGDNASYKRVSLLAHPEFLRDGFWELEYHKRLRREGRTLTFLPGMRVTLRRSFGLFPFLAHRFRHGREFGQARLRGRGPALRIAAIVASPLIPLLLAGKIAMRVARSGRDLGPFAACSPILLCFVLAWALGETAGYLAPASPAADGPLGERLT
jgi:hypothetical protein